MEKLTIALLRHGDYHQPKGVPSAMLAYDLNAAGEAQAEKAATALADYAEDHKLTLSPELDSSLMLRAWHTAEIISKGFEEHRPMDVGYHIRQSVLLAERSVGAMANLTVDQIETLLIADPRYNTPPLGWKSDSHYCLPFQGAESLLQAGERVAKHIETCHKTAIEAPGRLSQLKVIVGHGASIRHAAAHLGILNLNEVASISMHHAEPIYIQKQGEQWHQIGGEWKPRLKASDGDEIRV